MPVKTTSLFALLLSLAGPVAAACPDDAGFKKLASFEHLYLGETHGTEEVPQLVQCLVQSAIAARPQSLVVSLEMPDDARRPDSLQWEGRDGRASQAMWRLHQWLQAQEAAGVLKLHHHLPTDRYPDQADYEKAAGLALNALMRQTARVIVLSGAFHSRREPLAWMPHVRPMGTFVGEGTVHVELRALEGGTAWEGRSTAPPGEKPPPPVYAAHSQPAMPPGSGNPGELIDGKSAGHDYIYLIRSFTASPPVKQSH